MNEPFTRTEATLRGLTQVSLPAGIKQSCWLIGCGIRIAEEGDLTASEYRSGGRCQIEQTRIVLLIWTTVIVMIGILPLDNFVGHSHWEYIKWIPNAEDVKSPKYLLDIFTDIIGNTALYFPFGYFLSRLLSNRTPSAQVVFAAALGGALSVSIEYYQIYSHNRFPSILDIIFNVFGSLIGARFALLGKAPEH